METTQAPAVKSVKSTRHNASNDKYANDGSYESVKGLILNVSIKCFKRVEAFGLGMTLDDVKQEMFISYMRAKEKFDPSKEVLFSTYMTQALYWNFNEVIRRAEVERRNLGLINMTDLRPVDDNFFDDDADPMDSFGVEPEYEANIEFGQNHITGKLEVPEAPMSCNPAAFLEQAQEAAMSHYGSKLKLRLMTENTKAILLKLLKAEEARIKTSGKDIKLPKLTTLLREAGHSEKECKRIRAEIIAAFGVKI